VSVGSKDSATIILFLCVESTYFNLYMSVSKKEDDRKNRHTCIIKPIMLHDGGFCYNR
jgi:hypothetical protein